MKRKLFGFRYTLSGNRLAYYFLLLHPLQEPLLKRKLADDTAFTVTDYGELVASGYGTPSDDLVKRLQKRYA